MTVKQRIYEEILRQTPNKVSNAGIARSLDLNEPTVRRATKELKNEGSIIADYSGANWGSNQGVVYGVPSTGAVESQSASL